MSLDGGRKQCFSLMSEEEEEEEEIVVENLRNNVFSKGGRIRRWRKKNGKREKYK